MKIDKRRYSSGENMKITGEQTVELEVTRVSLAYATMAMVLELLHLPKDFDDAGCDWVTSDNYTYIGDENWRISNDENIAVLVDAANIMKYGETLRIIR